MSQLSFDDVVAPLGGERFKAEVLGQKPLHLPGAEDRFAEVMTWEQLDRLLEMTTVWSAQSLMLYLDAEQVPPASYCAPAPGRDGGQVLRPVPEKVMAQVAKGATLILNDIDQLTPGLRAAAGAIERALGAKVQANLYFSSQPKQGFAAHFDQHDVFAIHVAGRKTWHVYDGRFEHPIAHPAFRSLGRDYHEEKKGRRLDDVVLTPGDLLYLPRGQYHDAIAHEGGAIHIAFGAVYPIGLDALGYLYERMVMEPLARADLPQDEAALGERLRALGRRVAEVLAQPQTLAQVWATQAEFSYSRPGYDVRALIEPERAERFRVRANGIRLVRAQGRVGLVREGSKRAIEVPGEVGDMVAWVLERPQFSRAELDARFADEPAARRAKLLQDLSAMRLTEALA